MFSARVKSSTRPRRWRSSGMCPRPASSTFLALVFSTFLPPTMTCPARMLRRPVIASISSLWPLPSTPASPTISPARTSNDTSRTAGRPRSSSTDTWSTVRSVSPGSDGFFSTLRRTSRPTMRRASWPRVAPSRNRVDLLPAPQDGNPVGDLEHLVQLVRDEDHRHPLAREVAQDPEELEGLLRESARRSARRGSGRRLRGTAPSGSRRAAAARR